jgi:hypothetical protein
MAQLQFPKVEAPRQSGFMNLNGDGGRIQLLISVPIILVVTVIAWLVWEPESGFNWVGVISLIAFV